MVFSFGAVGLVPYLVNAKNRDLAPETPGTNACPQSSAEDGTTRIARTGEFWTLTGCETRSAVVFW